MGSWKLTSWGKPKCRIIICWGWMGCWWSQWAFDERFCPEITRFFSHEKAGATLSKAISTDGKRVWTTSARDSMIYDESGQGNMWSWDFKAGIWSFFLGKRVAAKRDIWSGDVKTRVWKRMGRIQMFIQRHTERRVRALELLVEAECNMISCNNSVGSQDQTSVEGMKLESYIDQ